MDYNSYNFFEPFAKTPPKTNFVNLCIGSIITVLLGVLLAFTGLAYFEKQNLAVEADGKQQQIDALAASLAEVTALTEQLQEIQSAREGIGTLVTMQDTIHVGRPDIFQQLGMLAPDKLYLTRVHISGLRMEIEGVAQDSDIVGIYENNLRSAMNRILGPAVSQYERVVQEETDGYYTFSISCTVFNLILPTDPQPPTEEMPEGTAQDAV